MEDSFMATLTLTSHNKVEVGSWPAIGITPPVVRYLLVFAGQGKSTLRNGLFGDFVGYFCFAG